jgi:methionyl-tRNA formyltransferase
LGLAVFSPPRINTEEEIARLQELAPECIVVVAYGHILRPAILDIPSKGCINVHTSLLPAYRGAAPIQWAVAGGEKETGVTTMHMSEGMDEGDIILQRSTPISPDETAGSVHDRLADLGAELIVETLDRVEAGDAPRCPQDDGAASYAPKLNKEDGHLDWALPADVLRNRVRGFNPWPCCYARLPDGKRLRVLEAAVWTESDEAEPGTIVDVTGAPVVQTGTGLLELTCVQPEGGKAMAGDAFVRGHRLTPGTQLT